MGHTLLQIVDWLLWIPLAASTLYILFFALASMFPGRAKKKEEHDEHHSFLVLFPAYKEDKVITGSVQSVMQQDYPKEHFHVAVISDHMEASTNEQLSALGANVLVPHFDKSSKAKALQFAMENETWGTNKEKCKVVILDADNVVEPDFLRRLNDVCHEGHRAIQCHRTAKNSNNGISTLDGVSEEINNSLFRRGHSRVGLSAVLIGSGMCFDHDLFSQDVKELHSAVEDRELDGLLALQRVGIHYVDDIMVYDEKVSSSENFQRQRQRWITGQVQTLLMMLRHFPAALLKGNVNYVDKTLQQALIPRSLLLLFTPPLAVVFTVLSFIPALAPYLSPLRWWLLLAAECLAIFIAIPGRLRIAAMRHALLVPRMAWTMAKNVVHVRLKDKEFHHTTHTVEN